MDDWRERTLGLTFVLLAASVLLIGPSLAGVGASIPLFVALLAVGAVLGGLRSRLADLPTVAGHEVGTYAKELWLGPVVAVVVVVPVAPAASAGELQSLGGLAGFLGMFNYFVRPLYFTLYNLVRRYLPTDRMR
jgi:hypothetical protein